MPGVGDLVKLAPATVVSGFSKLGMSADLAKKFVPIVLGYLRKHAGAQTVAKVEAALRA